MKYVINNGPALLFIEGIMTVDEVEELGIDDLAIKVSGNNNLRLVSIPFDATDTYAKNSLIAKQPKETVKMMEARVASGEKLPRLENVFTVLNQYIMDMPQQNQANAFRLIVDLYLVGDDPLGVDLSDMGRRIEDLLVEFGYLHELYDWICDNMDMPSDVKSSLTDTMIPDKTYLKHDYHYLTELSMAMKIILPIMNVILVNLNSSSQRLWMDAIKHLPPLVTSSTGHKKLFGYITANLRKKNPASTAQVLEYGISSEVIKDWMMSMVLLGKLTPVMYGKIKGNAHLVSYTHSFMTNKMKVGSKYTDKDKTGKGSDDDMDSESSYQVYRVKCTLSVGQQVELEYCASKEYLSSMMRRYFTEEEEEICKKLTEIILEDNLPLDIATMTIVTWTLAFMVDPETYGFSDQEGLRRLTAFASVLLARDHPFIASYLLSHKYYVGDICNRDNTNINNNKIPDELADELFSKYPIWYTKGEKKQVTTAGRPNKEKPLTKVLRLLDKPCNYQRQVSIPMGYLPESLGDYIKEKRLVPTDNKRILMAKLLINLDTLLDTHDFKLNKKV